MRKINPLWVLLPLFFIQNCLFADAARSLPLVSAGRISQPVVLDGRLQEPFWERIPEASSFNILGRRTVPALKTSFKVAYTDQFILLGVFCAEPEMDKLRAVAEHRDDSQVCSDDSIELFLQPDNGYYYQFAANSAGLIYDGRRPARMGLSAKEMQEGLLWDGAWEAMVFHGPDFWSAELRIPFAILELGIAGNAPWRINLGRTESRVGYSSWAPVKKGFHDLESYGTLQKMEPDLNGQALDFSQVKFPDFLIGSNRFSLALPTLIADDSFQVRQSLRVWEPGLLPERQLLLENLRPENGFLHLSLEVGIQHAEELQELILEIVDGSGRTQGLLTHLFRPPKPFTVSLPWSSFSNDDKALPVNCVLQASPQSAKALLHFSLRRAASTLPLLQQRVKLHRTGKSTHFVPLRKLPEHGHYQLHWTLEFQGLEETSSGKIDFFFLK